MKDRHSEMAMALQLSNRMKVLCKCVAVSREPEPWTVGLG